jgi:hypothetical protein
VKILLDSAVRLVTSNTIDGFGICWPVHPLQVPGRINGKVIRKSIGRITHGLVEYFNEAITFFPGSETLCVCTSVIEHVVSPVRDPYARESNDGTLIASDGLIAYWARHFGIVERHRCRSTCSPAKAADEAWNAENVTCRHS